MRLVRKSISTILLLCLVSYVEVLYADSECTLNDAATFKNPVTDWPEPIAKSELMECDHFSPSLVAFLKTQLNWKGVDPNIRFSGDLNFDGKCDYFVLEPNAMYGSGGMPQWIYVSDGESFNFSGLIRTWWPEYLEKYNGHVQLGSSVDGGAGSTRNISYYRFDGEQYRWYRSVNNDCDFETADWVFVGTSLNE